MAKPFSLDGKEWYFVRAEQLREGDTVLDDWKERVVWGVEPRANGRVVIFTHPVPFSTDDLRESLLPVDSQVALSAWDARQTGRHQ